jgi:hypothetical protein
MKTIDTRSLINRFDLRWTLATYCYLVLFHLLLSYYLLYPGMTFTFTAGSSGTFVWLGVGIVIASVYISFRSATLLFFETALASLLYCVTILQLFSTHLPSFFKYTLGTRIAIVILYVILSLTSSAIMAWTRIRRNPSEHT